MKYLILILLSPIILLGQSLTVFDIDTTNFPTIKAKFYAFDAGGNQILNLSPSDFEVTEDGLLRYITNVNCHDMKPPIPLSAILTIDVSGSMVGDGMLIAKDAARSWVNSLPFKNSECAITCFDNANYIVQDFTNNQSKLLEAIEKLKPQGGTDYNYGLYKDFAGSLLIAESAKMSKAIIFLTDGQPDNEPEVDLIIAKAKEQNCPIFPVVLKMECPECLKRISYETGSKYFDNVNNNREAQNIFQQILAISQGSKPCEIEWVSGIGCKSSMVSVNIKINSISALSQFYYHPTSFNASLDLNPNGVKYFNAKPGIKSDIPITITARNADFIINDIISSNSAFSIAPSSFTLNRDESKQLIISFIPEDSSYIYSKFSIVSNICPTNLFASGGFPGKIPKSRTLKIVQPNGGEEYLINSDSLISWEGIANVDKVKIEFSTDIGNTWTILSHQTDGLEYKWSNLPNEESKDCLIKITQIGSGSVDSLIHIDWQKTFGGSSFD